MRPETPNRGAADERSAILRKVRRLLKLTPTPELEALAAWIADRDLRTAAKPRGLGRKLKGAQ